MKAAYVGILSAGSTSRMRAECLKKILPEAEWEWIDTDTPMQASARPWRSLAFRAYRGPAVDRINDLVMKSVAGKSFDLVWVDKGVFLKASTTRILRDVAGKMVHFTPDTAFHANRSPHFEKSMRLYELLVTTKSFELEQYRKRVSAESIMLTTQGYDADVHFPRNGLGERRREAAFVGLAEPDRERCIASLLDGEVPVRLAGLGWSGFLRRYGNHPLLTFEGEGLFGEEYAKLLSRSWVGLGLLSKNFPELHTTRTFEIPACGAVLATEQTADTARFFDPSEAIFFRDYESLALRLNALFAEPGPATLTQIATAGRHRVKKDARDYRSILRSILSNPRVGL